MPRFRPQLTEGTQCLDTASDSMPNRTWSIPSAFLTFDPACSHLHASLIQQAAILLTDLAMPQQCHVHLLQKSLISTRHTHTRSGQYAYIKIDTFPLLSLSLAHTRRITRAGRQQRGTGCGFHGDLQNSTTYHQSCI